jgi:Domain of unknown function (DUF5658)
VAVFAERYPRGLVSAGPWTLPGFGLCAAILLLNLMDALFTLMFLQSGLAEEANPLMDLVYRISPTAFVLLKLAMVQAGILILHYHRRVPIAQHALHGVAAVYVAIVGYHFAFVAHLAWR